MDYTMEDTQNSAPGLLTAHESAKLSSGATTTTTQSVAKRWAKNAPLHKIDLT